MPEHDAHPGPEHAMRWLLSAPLRGWVMLAAAASLLLNLALLAPSIFMLQVFDRVFASGSLETLTLLAIGTALMLAVGYAMDALRQRALGGAAAAVDRALTPRIVKTLMRQSARAPGRHDAAPMADAGRLRSLLTSPAAHALFDAPWLPVYLAAIALMDIRLGLAATLAVLLLVAMAGLQHRGTRDATERATQHTRHAAREIDGLLRDAQPLVAMGLEHAALHRWQQVHATALAAGAELQQGNARLGAASRMLRQLLQCGLVAFGAVLVIDGHASPGIMVATTVLLTRALQPVEQLIAGWRALADARQAWARLERLPADEPDDDAADGTAAQPATVMAAPAGALRLEQVVPARTDATQVAGDAGDTGAAPPAPAATAVEPVNLQVAPGQCLVLVGASGVGKSRWLQLMLGLVAPAAGRVWWGDFELHARRRDALAGAIGYLPQQVPLFAASLAENLSGDAQPDPVRVAAVARQVGLDGEARRLPQAYDTPIGEGGTAVSGGQRQRIGLARALYRAPRLVVLDEPDAHLDGPGLTCLQAVVAELKASGAIVVMTTHRRPLIALADQIGLVGAGGRLEALGPRDEVLARLGGPVVQPLRRASA